MNAVALTTGVVVLLGVAVTASAGRQALRLGRANVVLAALGHRVRGVPTRRFRHWRTPPPWFAALVADAPLKAEEADAWRWYVVAVGGAFTGGWWVAGPALAVVATALVAGAPPAVIAVVRTRQTAAYDAALAAALDAMARAVRGGASLHAALGEAALSVRGQVADDLHRVAGGAQRGTPIESALDEWKRRRSRPAVRLAVGAITLASQTGGPPARVIEDVAASLRMRMQVEGEARALGAQARLSAVVVGVAPIGFALVSSAADPRNARMMFGTPIGVACLVAGLILDLIGAVWMHRVSETVLS